MTDAQIKRITELREQGIGYGKISRILGLSLNTVKSYCRRNGLGGMRLPIKDEDIHVCKFCGKEVKQNPGRKKKMFCDSSCRQRWWNSHLDMVKRKAIYEYECPVCHEKFSAYGNSHRRYCSRLCYLTDRFGYRDYWNNRYDGNPENSTLYTSEMSG